MKTDWRQRILCPNARMKSSKMKESREQMDKQRENRRKKKR